MNRNQTLEYLENEFWYQPSLKETGLIQRCYAYRKIQIDQLTVEQLRTLASQEIGVKYILEIILEKLAENVLAEGDFYPGDLLMVTKKIPTEYWSKDTLDKFDFLIKSNKSIILEELGSKELNLLLDKINDLNMILKK